MRKMYSKEEFINLSKKVHKNKYQYDKVVYKGNKKKVKIKCPVHGYFEQVAGSHLNGNGCLKCSGKYPLNTKEFINRAKRVHGDSYNYSLVKYTRMFDSVKIKCKKHGVFEQAAYRHLQGQGCIKCGFDRAIASRHRSLKSFIKEAKEIHGKKYDYSKVSYKDIRTKVEIICKLHGSFWQQPKTHLYRDKNGCPVCKNSKGESRISSFLDKNKIKYEPQKTFDDCFNPKTGRKLKYDFYIPSKNILIEYDGEQHYVFGKKLGNYITNKKDLQNIKFRDSIKTKYAKRRKIKLLRIKHTLLYKIESILQKELL